MPVIICTTFVIFNSFFYNFSVDFTDCTDHTIFLFSTDDSRFGVKADGVLVVSRLNSKVGIILKIAVRFVELF